MKYPDTGLYHYCLNLGRYLEKNTDLRRESIHFYTPPGESRHFFNDHQHVTQNPLHKFVLPPLTGFDIWHATYQNTRYMPVMNRKIKVVLSVHDLNFMYDDKKSPAKKQKYLDHLQQLINRADAIVCISEFSKADVLKHCDTGNKPVYVILNGSNLLEEPELDEHSYIPGQPFLFSIGVMQRKKNYHVLFPLLQEKKMELVIAGRPDDSQYLQFLRRKSWEMGV